MKQRKEYAAQEDARLLLRRSTSALDPCAGRPHNDALPSHTAGTQNSCSWRGAMLVVSHRVGRGSHCCH